MGKRQQSPPLALGAHPDHLGTMPEPLATSGYDRVIVIDTQVVLEAKPLDQLPWAEFGDGPIGAERCVLKRGWHSWKTEIEPSLRSSLRATDWATRKSRISIKKRIQLDIFEN